MNGFLNNNLTYQGEYTLRDVVDGLGYDIGLREYPIFDENYRMNLNQGIKRHFWYRRIAADTPARFIFFLNRKMAEVMPTYNALYRKLAEADFDPFLTSQAKARSMQTTNAENEDSSNATGQTVAYNSTTPATFMQNAQDPKYMDALTRNDSSSATGTKGTHTTTNTGESTQGATDDWLTTFERLRERNVIAVDTALYNELEPLFIGVWSDYND